MNGLARRVRALLNNPDRFSAEAGGITLRPYQSPAIRAVVDSVRHRWGDTIVWMFSRQSGKDEGLAVLVTYLLSLFQQVGGDVIMFNPTYKPQTVRAKWRLKVRLETNLLTRKRWRREEGFIYRLGLARAILLSAQKRANVVGETAGLLLVANEAQDIDAGKWDEEIAPMGAANNATTLMLGTRWTSDTLLEREYKSALQLQEQTGRQLVFIVDANEVRKHIAAYGRHVDARVRKLGRDHPLIRTQYFNETIDAQAGMFPPTRRALMLGDRPGAEKPQPGHIYLFQLDVAGQDEAKLAGQDYLLNPGRDVVSLTITDVDLSSLTDLDAPTYRAINRLSWIGESHRKIFGQLKSLLAAWRPAYLLMDATGVGEGLYGFTRPHYGEDRVIGIKYNATIKSEIGYKFLAVINSGRFRDCCTTKTIESQYAACRSEIQPGPARLMRWGVPEGYRDPTTGELVHDDVVMSDSLCALADDLPWVMPVPAVIAHRPDYAKQADTNY